jgi:hypothetical protein
MFSNREIESLIKKTREIALRLGDVDRPAECYITPVEDTKDFKVFIGSIHWGGAYIIFFHAGNVLKVEQEHWLEDTIVYERVEASRYL